MKKSISPTTFNVLSLIVLSFALLNGCSDNTGLGNGPPPPSPDQTETLKDEAIREMAKVKPSPELLNAVKQFQEEDVDASFSWLNGHVDNFATSAKETVPEYALPILKDLGLPTEPKKPLRLPDPTYAKELEKPGNTLDDDFKERLPYVTERQRTQEVSEGKDDQEDESRQGPPKEEIRTDPAKNQERMIKWDRPDDKTLSLERKATEPILKAFLKEYQAVFEVNADQFKGGMQFQDFQHGAYFKKAVYQQAYGVGENVLYGKTLVHFDVNWNVIGISRMIVTQEKLKIPTTEKQISRQKASSTLR